MSFNSHFTGHGFCSCGHHFHGSHAHKDHHCHSTNHFNDHSLSHAFHGSRFKGNCDRCGLHSNRCRCHRSSHGFHHNDFCHSCFDHRFFSFDRLCGQRFRLRLGGLQGGMGFRLGQLIGCKVKIGIDCEGNEEQVKGKICFVGTDFVEIERDEKKNEKKVRRCRGKKKRAKDKDKFRIIPFDTIGWVDIQEDKCC
jgi:hypothetical protein